jgi:hypothetical protein
MSGAETGQIRCRKERKVWNMSRQILARTGTCVLHINIMNCGRISLQMDELTEQLTNRDRDA